MYRRKNNKETDGTGGQPFHGEAFGLLHARPKRLPRCLTRRHTVAQSQEGAQRTRSMRTKKQTNTKKLAAISCLREVISLTTNAATLVTQRSSCGCGSQLVALKPPRRRSRVGYARRKKPSPLLILGVSVEKMGRCSPSRHLAITGRSQSNHGDLRRIYQ